MSNLAIRAEGLGKRYCIGAAQERYRTVRETLMSAATLPARAVRAALAGNRRRRRQEASFWALKGVSFEIRSGEVVGIIGRNGAGKSTLLKILSRITEPTEGYADIDGRVGSLLEVGTGFHPELTGRENVFLNGAILGMPRAEIERKFDEIVAFAEVSQFVDTPVKHYSSGMYLRLAFAVAAHLEPNVLLVDEVLAVGDAAFQRKCLGQMEHVARNGRTVLLVSHNMAAISALCTRTLLLNRGEVSYFGETDQAVRRYIADAASNATTHLTERSDRQGSGRARIERIEVIDDRDRPTDVVPAGGEAAFAMSYASADGQAVTNALFEIKVTDQFDQPLFTMSTFLTGDSFPTLPDRGTVHCHVPSLLLVPGVYSLKVICYVNNELADLVSDAKRLTVAEADVYGGGRAIRARTYGPFLMPQRWSFRPDEASAVPALAASRVAR